MRLQVLDGSVLADLCGELEGLLHHLEAPGVGLEPAAVAAPDRRWPLDVAIAHRCRPEVYAQLCRPALASEPALSLHAELVVGDAEPDVECQIVAVPGV